METKELIREIKKHFKQLQKDADQTGLNYDEYFDTDTVEGYANSLLSYALTALEAKK